MIIGHDQVAGRRTDRGATLGLDSALSIVLMLTNHGEVIIEWDCQTNQKNNRIYFFSHFACWTHRSPQTSFKTPHKCVFWTIRYFLSFNNTSTVLGVDKTGSRAKMTPPMGELCLLLSNLEKGNKFAKWTSLKLFNELEFATHLCTDICTDIMQFWILSQMFWGWIKSGVASAISLFKSFVYIAQVLWVGVLSISRHPNGFNQKIGCLRTHWG